eukprot:145217-Rhodomonas_salina.1
MPRAEEERKLADGARRAENVVDNHLGALGALFNAALHDDEHLGGVFGLVENPLLRLEEDLAEQHAHGVEQPVRGPLEDLNVFQELARTEARDFHRQTVAQHRQDRRLVHMRPVSAPSRVEVVADLDLEVWRKIVAGDETIHKFLVVARYPTSVPGIA